MFNIKRPILFLGIIGILMNVTSPTCARQEGVSLGAALVGVTAAAVGAGIALNYLFGEPSEEDILENAKNCYIRASHDPIAVVYASSFSFAPNEEELFSLANALPSNDIKRTIDSL